MKRLIGMIYNESGDGHLSSSQNPDPERDLMEGTSKHGDMTDQTKRYTFMSSDQLHTAHTSNTSISSCQNSGGYTDTLTHKKSVRNPISQIFFSHVSYSHIYSFYKYHSATRTMIEK